MCVVVSVPCPPVDGRARLLLRRVSGPQGRAACHALALARPDIFHLRGFQPGDRLPEAKSRLCSAPRGWPGRRLQLTSLGLRSAGARRSTRQVSGPGSWTECVSSAEKGPGSWEA